MIRLDARPEIRRSRAQGKIACEGFELEENERLARGTAVHRFIHRWTAFAVGTGREPTREEARTLAKSAWADTLGLDTFDFEDFMQLCEGYAQSHLADLDTLIGYEQTLKLDVGWAVLTCTYDRLDRIREDDPDDPLWRALLRDYKTEHRRMDHEFQKRWYGQMVLLTTASLKEVWWQEDPLRSPNLPEPERIVRGQFDKWWEATLQALYQRELQPTGERYGSVNCFECLNRLDCAHALRPATILPGTDEEAKLLAREHRRFQAGADARWNALTNYLNGRSPLFVDGEYVGHMRPLKDRLVITAPDEAVLDYLSQTPGLDLSNIQRWPSSSSLVTSRGLLENRGIQEKLVQAGLAKFVTGEPEMKARKTPPTAKS